MVNFNKLRSAKSHQVPIDPIEVFRRLPKPPGINDLFASQAEVLTAWFSRRNERDLVIKLHTGGGKTLVGLLIAQSALNETHEPVIYLSPTVQLVQQTLDKAREYNIPAIAYEKDVAFSDEFLSGKSVFICSYQALFNGRSRFGVRGSSREKISAAAIIFDDAHVSFSSMRDIFTLRVDADSNEEAYRYLAHIFRDDFTALGKVGTFDDVVSGGDYTVLDVPYWSWQNRSSQVRDFLREQSDKYPFTWPLLRDSFDYCQCLISRKAFVVTPILPLVDMIPTFSECKRRVFMSATIADDSAIIRTFDAEPDSISKPITSKSLAGISERMILIPELMNIAQAEIPQMLRKLATWIPEHKKAGTVILTPSIASAKKWEDIATAVEGEKVIEAVKSLQTGKSHGPFVFANRYDGIDLPNEACRLLIMSELPRGIKEYDLYRMNTFTAGATINSELAQRIEQGIGRGVRGAGDYCVVVLMGKDLVAWISRSANIKFLTSSTRAQLDMGDQISKEITDKSAFADVIVKCLERNRDWVEYHAERLAELTALENAEQVSLDTAALERKTLKLIRDGYFDQALTRLKRYCSTSTELDRETRGWLLQFAARVALYWGKKQEAQELQQRAYAENHNLLRPQVIRPYESLELPGKQSEMMVTELLRYERRRGYLAHFDQTVANLVPSASANQFEQSLAELGTMLGFQTERPDKDYGKGPDVLWLIDDRTGLVIEAKSRKNQDNALTKEQHGQLLNAAEWFKATYPQLSCVRVSVHPNVNVTKSTVPGESKALTLQKLNELVTEVRILLSDLCDSSQSKDGLIMRCEQLLATGKLTPSQIIEHYLVPFQS